jgi:hypothetical protein
MTGDERRALELAQQSGFHVLPDGFVQIPSVGDSLKAMIIDLVRRAQADTIDNDGK